MKYLVIFEETGKSVGAYVPDLPGCVAIGETRDEASISFAKRSSSTSKASVNTARRYPSPTHSSK